MARMARLPTTTTLTPKAMRTWRRGRITRRRARAIPRGMLELGLQRLPHAFSCGDPCFQCPNIRLRFGWEPFPNVRG